MRTGHEVQAHIVMKAADDLEFRERLASDPKGVIEAETGLVLPADKLIFVQNAIETASQPLASEVALTEEELAEVMGGTCADGMNTEWHNCD